MKLRCLSLHQPHASAVALGLKKIETRGRNTYVSGLIGIHAAQLQTEQQGLKFNSLVAEHPSIERAFDRAGHDHFESLPFGKIIAVGYLVDCVGVRFVDLKTLSAAELALGDYSEGRFLWFLKDVTRLAVPIPFSGSQGFFFADVNPSQLKEAA